MSWTDKLEVASFRGVIFNVQSTDDELSRRLAQYKYPFRDGADHEDVGREPRPSRITAVFLGKDYETSLSELLQIVDEGIAGTFVHPIFGSWNARIRRVGIKHDYSQRDMATVDLDIIEEGTNTALPEMPSISALQAQLEEDADAADEANTTEIAEVTTATVEAKSFSQTVKDSLSRATATVNSVRKRIDSAVAKARQLTDVQNYPLVRALKKLSYSVKSLGDRVQAMRPPVILKRLQAAIPITALAHHLYGDAKRASELLSMNTVRNPFIIPAGTELKVYAR